tara:strand:- start:6545 stop:7387 length:843 start_codon:yes stop_codon:yes gene_type:complete
MSLARPTSTVERGSGVVPDSGPTSAWNELQHTDMAIHTGGYGVSIAAGSNGFSQRMTIDGAADSSYFKTSVCSFVYYDTGISLASLADKKVVTLSLVMEFNIAVGDALVSDSGGQFHFGPCISNTSDPDDAACGFFAGTICSTGTANTVVRPSSGVGKTGNTSTLSLGAFQNPDATGALGNGFDASNGDTLVQMQLSASGLNAKQIPNKFGWTGADILYGIRKAGSTFCHDLTENVLKDDRRAGLGNLLIGVLAGQKHTGTPASKNLDFNFKYLLETIDA